MTQRKLEAAEFQLELRRGECESTTMKYEEVVERLNEAEQKVKEGELLRKRLHNTILVCVLWLQVLEALSASLIISLVIKTDFYVFLLNRS